MAALGVRCNQMLGLKANVYQIILAIHLEAIGNVKQPPILAFLVLLDGSLLKVIGMVYSHSRFSLVLILDVGEAAVCFLWLF